MDSQLITVRGPIPAAEMGTTLPHEHILVDFDDPALVGPHRYDRAEVIRVMLPQLEAIRRQGVETLVECTPMHLGRDPLLLKELSEVSGLNIVTNTGQYMEPHLPAETYTASAQQLAEAWIQEYGEGIDGTDVKPGFVKTAVPPGDLVPVQQKILEAAAFTSLQTGLTIATHVEDSGPIHSILGLWDRLGVDPGKWILVHAQLQADLSTLNELAGLGVWIELDGVGEETVEQHLDLTLKLLEAGRQEQILLSQDAGWYNVGQPEGGDQVPFTFLMASFIPLLRVRGLSDLLIHQLTVTNPAAAYAF